MVTIRDLAKMSGHSVSTVSRVLNNHPHVSDQTRQEILALIEETSYRPNLLAQDLSRGKTNKVGVVLPHTRHPYFTQLLNGLLDAASGSQHQLLLMPSDYDQKTELSYLEQLRGGAIDSLIFTSHSLDLSTIASYSSYGNIILCEETNQAGVASVYIDRTHAYLQLFAYLRQQGCHHPVLLFSRADETSATFRQAMTAYAAHYSLPAQTYTGLFLEEDGYHIAQKWLDDPSVDAVVANSDQIALGVLGAYADRKLEPPLIIGQEKQLASRILHFPSIDHKSYELGTMAFQQAIADKPSNCKLTSCFIQNP